MSKPLTAVKALRPRLANKQPDNALQSNYTLSGIIPRIIASDLPLEEKLVKIIGNRFLPISIKALWAKKLIQQGADVSTRNHLVLRWACEHGDLELVQCVLAKGGNIKCLKNEPLIRAAINGHHYVVQYLLNHGADLHARHDAALRLSVSMGHASIVSELLAHGANVTARRNESIRKAFDGGFDTVLKVLLTKKAKDILSYAQAHQDLQVFAIVWDYAQKHSDEALVHRLEQYPYRPTLQKPSSLQVRPSLTSL